MCSCLALQSAVNHSSRDAEEVWPRPICLWQARFFRALLISKHFMWCHVTHANKMECYEEDKNP